MHAGQTGQIPAKKGLAPKATHAGSEEHCGAPWLTSAEFDALFTQLRDATARGPEDRRGALNNLTPGHVLAAIGEVRSGQTVSLAAPIETVASPDNPEPCGHALTGDGGDRTMTPGLHFAMDRLAMNVLAIKAMGLHLLDYLQFEELVPLCEEADRWTFLCVIAPLRLPSATGSPVNPIAIL